MADAGAVGLRPRAGAGRPAAGRRAAGRGASFARSSTSSGRRRCSCSPPTGRTGTPGDLGSVPDGLPGADILSENARSALQAAVIVDCRHPRRAGSETACTASSPRPGAAAQRGRLGARGRGAARRSATAPTSARSTPRATPRAARTDSLAARRLAARVEPAVPARAAPRPLRRRVRRADPDARRGRAARPESGAALARPSTTGRPPSGSTRAAAARVDQRRLRGRRARPRGRRSVGCRNRPPASGRPCSWRARRPRAPQVLRPLSARRGGARPPARRSAPQLGRGPLTGTGFPGSLR